MMSSRLQNLWLRCQLQEQQGRVNKAPVSGAPEGVQAVHRQDGAQLDQRDAREESQHEGACKPLDQIYIWVRSISSTVMLVIC